MRPEVSVIIAARNAAAVMMPRCGGWIARRLA
jgi:hypothetical protein